MRAVLASKQADCRAAVTHFELSRDVIASQPEALKAFGFCLASLERLPEAATLLEQAISASPSDRQARYTLASIRIKLHLDREAIEALAPLLEPPVDAEASSLASSAYEALGETSQAVESLRRAIVLSPLRIDYYLDFASLSFVHESPDVGISMLNAGLQVSPRSGRLYLARGVLYAQVGNTDKADSDFAMSGTLDPGLAGAGSARVVAALQYGSTEQAFRLVQEEIEKEPNDPFLQYLLAEILNKQGVVPPSAGFKQAIDALVRALELNPKLILARNLLSQMYLQEGSLDLAIEQCDRVLNEDPENTVALYRFMRVLKMKGDPQNAGKLEALTKRFNNARQSERQQETRETRYRIIDKQKETSRPTYKPKVHGSIP